MEDSFVSLFKPGFIYIFLSQFSSIVLRLIHLTSLLRKNVKKYICHTVKLKSREGVDFLIDRNLLKKIHELTSKIGKIFSSIHSAPSDFGGEVE